MQTAVAVFHPEGNVSNNPHLWALTRILHDKGIKVDVFARFDGRNPYQEDPSAAYTPHVLRGNEPMRLPHGNYAFVLGVDEGIIEAAAEAQRHGLPYAHISYEIFFEDELEPFPDFMALNHAIKPALKNSRFSVLQDNLRARLYALEYGVPQERIMQMPVAGAAVIPYQPSNYLHTLAGLPASAKILLHMGVIGQWVMTDWLIERASTLPPDWAMVIHGRYGKPADTSKYEHERVYYTNCPKADFDQMKDLVQSASCCVSLFRNWPTHPRLMKNITNIGLSSGKCSTALQHGIPVMVQNGGEMAALVREYAAGICLNTTPDQSLALLEQLAPVGDTVGNCHRLFSERLSINNFMPEFMARMGLSA